MSSEAFKSSPWCFSMLNIEYKFYQTMSQMISGDNKILAAISGGIDSTVMLSLLYNYKLKHSNFSLAIAHLNHLSRGEDSYLDAVFVRELGEKLNLETFIEEIDIKKLYLNKKTSFQETARNARHAFLNRVLTKWEGDIIAFGHNADDQAETLLINILRGSGLRGLTGTLAKNNNFFRPLYNSYRSEIKVYADKFNIEYCSDFTNFKTNYLRNKVRHELIPLLESYNPQIKSSLIENSRLLAGDDDCLQEQVQRIMDSSDGLGEGLSGFPSLNIKIIKKQHPALQKRLIRQAIFLIKGNLRSISSQHVLSIIDLINSPVGTKSFHLPGCISAICDGRELSFCKTPLNNEDIDNNSEVVNLSIDLNVPGYTILESSGLRIKAELLFHDKAYNDFYNPNRAYLDYAKTGSKLKVRFFRPGDRFVPLGMKGSKKLKTFFIDEKVPRKQRLTVPILTAKNEDIIWVYEKRISEKYRITDKTSKILLLEGERYQ